MWTALQDSYYKWRLRCSATMDEWSRGCRSTARALHAKLPFASGSANNSYAYQHRWAHHSPMLQLNGLGGSSTRDKTASDELVASNAYRRSCFIFNQLYGDMLEEEQAYMLGRRSWQSTGAATMLFMSIFWLFSSPRVNVWYKRGRWFLQKFSNNRFSTRHLSTRDGTLRRCAILSRVFTLAVLYGSWSMAVREQFKGFADLVCEPDKRYPYAVLYNNYVHKIVEDPKSQSADNRLRLQERVDEFADKLPRDTDGEVAAAYLVRFGCQPTEDEEHARKMMVPILKVEGDPYDISEYFNVPSRGPHVQIRSPDKPSNDAVSMGKGGRSAPHKRVDVDVDVDVDGLDSDVDDTAVLAFVDDQREEMTSLRNETLSGELTGQNSSGDNLTPLSDTDWDESDEYKRPRRRKPPVDPSQTNKEPVTRRQSRRYRAGSRSNRARSNENAPVNQPEDL